MSHQDMVKEMYLDAENKFIDSQKKFIEAHEDMKIRFSKYSQMCYDLGKAELPADPKYWHNLERK